MESKTRLSAKSSLQSTRSLQSKSSLKTGVKNPLSQSKPLAKEPKKHSLGWWKKEARKWFNRAVKYRDSELIEQEWLFVCITCPRRVLFKDREGRFYRNANAGHFQPETYNNTRFGSENVNGQCSFCNHQGFGEQVKYARALDLKYGDGTAARLEEEAQIAKQWTIPELQEIISEAKEEIRFYEAQ